MLILVNISSYMYYANNAHKYFSMEQFYKTVYKEDFRVIVSHLGYVEWSFGGQLKTSCSLDLAEYPYDTQKCNIQIENFVYPAQLVSSFFLSRTLVTSIHVNPSLEAVHDTSMAIYSRSISL